MVLRRSSTLRTRIGSTGSRWRVRASIRDLRCRACLRWLISSSPIGQGATSDIYLVVRPASGGAAALTTAVRAAISRVDRDQLVGVRDIQTLADVASAATERHRFRAWLVRSLGGLACVLALLGI